MRDIVFKAKRIDNGEWVEGFLLIKYYQELPHDRFAIRYKTKGDEHEWTPKYLTTEINPETVCQYTGLTDMNGNKIWENDIICTDVGNVRVAYVTDPSPYENHYNAGFEVLFANVTDNENYRHDLGYWAILRGFEVVGNTFDNPELWK